MKRSPLALALSSALSLIHHGAHATDPAIVLGDVTILAPNNGPLPSSQVLTSVDILGGDKVQDKNVMNS